jgi:predicted nucleotidyltransferase
MPETALPEEPTSHLRGQARRIVSAALERKPLRAAILVGSAGRGDADFFSDIDLLFYVDELPPDAIFEEIRRVVGGTNPIRRGEPTEEFSSEEFELSGVRTEVSFVTVGRAEERLDQLLDELEAVGSPLQKVLAGILEGLPLHGDELVERWRERVRAYPEPLRRAMIERHWDFFPLWYYGESMAARDAELWRLDMLLDGAFNLLAVLAALNRLYFTRFELKRMRALIAKMEIVPPRLADRLESLFRLGPERAATEFALLVGETRALVAAELPDLELALQFPPGKRQQPWSS